MWQTLLAFACIPVVADVTAVLVSLLLLNFPAFAGVHAFAGALRKFADYLALTGLAQNT